MKRFIYLISLLLVPFCLLAQSNISKVEYWYDGDYGTASRQSISGSTVNYTDLLNVSALEPGLHTFTVRFQDTRGVWGSVLTKFFTYYPESSSGIHEVTDAEYWFDGDYASAAEVPLTPGTSSDLIDLLDVSSLIDGLHTATFRFKDDRGIWSSPLTRFFKTEATSGLKRLVALEYWYNNDYTNKEKSTFPPTSLLNLNEMLDVTALTEGLHIVSLRLQDESGRWSAPASYYFTNYKDETPELRQITALEYWFDGDYSSVQNDPVAATSILEIDDQIDVSGLSDGLHVVSCRFRDESGEWSPAYSVLFTKYPDEDAAEMHEITKLEYWFDNDYSTVVNDPVANATVLNIDEQIDVSALSDGLHSVSSRYKDEAGNWSPAYTTFFVKYLPDPTPDLREIVKVEYWIDGDYSQVNTELVTSTGLLVIDEQLDVSALNKGLHTLTYRFGDKSGGWSSTISTFFTIYNNEGVTPENKITGYRYWIDNNIDAATKVELAVPVKSLVLDELLDALNFAGGEHLISFQFEDSQGNWSSALSEFYQKEVNPTLSIAASATTVCAGSPLSFTASYSDADIIEWNFGDGSISSDFNPDHSYAQEGIYQVSAVVTHIDSAKSAYDTLIGGITVNASYNTWLGETDTLFFDSFEDETLGTLPSEWTLKYEGTGILNQKVVDSPVKNGVHAFQMEGSSGWASEFYKRLSSFPEEVTLEAWVNCEKILSGLAGSIGLGNFSVGTWGTRTSRLEFYNGKFVATYTGGSSFEIMDYTPGTWYHIRMVHDMVNLTYRVYINNVLMTGHDGSGSTSDFPMHPSVTTQDIMLAAGNSGVTKMFFDDILLSQQGSFPVCESDLPFVLGSQNISTEGTFTETFASANGCDSVVSLTLEIIPSANVTLNDTVCESELPYTLGSQSLVAAGTYTENIPSASGCDSSVTLNLAVLDSSLTNEVMIICESELPVTFGSQLLTSSGNYSEIFTAANGCDSTVTLDLTVLDTTFINTELDICENELPYTFGSQVLYTDGVYTEIFNNTQGCDSTVALTLNVLDTSLVNERMNICESNLPYVFGTQSLNASGVYSEVFPKSNGCDSTVVLSLTVKDTFSVSDAVTICESELPYNWEGDELWTSDTYNKVLTTANGCDSTVTLFFTVKDTSLMQQEVTVCESDLPYTLGTQSLTSGGIYTEVFAGANGCDSTVILTLNVNDTLRTNVDVAICEDDLPYIFGSRSLLSSGIYSDTLMNKTGCDSIVLLTLTVNDTFMISDEIKVCESELPFSWEGDELLTAGSYTKTLSSVNGCDSTVTLTIIVNDSSLIEKQVTICESELPYSFGNQSLTSKGRYTELFVKNNGCDSTVVLTLNVNDTSLISTEVEICESDLPYILGTQSLANSGTYTEIFTGENGCDSTVIVALTVNDTFRIADTLNVCENDLPFSFGTQSLVSDGTYTETFASSKGCDSTVVLAFSVIDTFNTSFADTVCENDLPYILGSQSLSTSGVYRETFTSQNGCDSIVTLNLLVNRSYRIIRNIEVETTDLPYIFGTQSITKAGTYTHNLTTVNGCDSIIVLRLTVHDNLPPSVQCNSLAVQLSANGEYIFSPSDIEKLSFGTSDNVTKYEDLDIQAVPSKLHCEHLGQSQVTLTVTDAAGNEARCTANIDVTIENSPPSIDMIPNVVMNEDDSANIQLSGIRAGTYCESWDPVVSVMHRNTALVDTMLVNYVPGDSIGILDIRLLADQFGTDSIFVTVEDTLGQTTVQPFLLTVNPVNDPPTVISSIEDQSVEATDTFEFAINNTDNSVFNDIDDSTLSYSAYLDDGGLPSWINVKQDDQVVLLCFIPTATDTGCFNIVVEAGDMEGSAVTDTFLLCVEPTTVVGIIETGGGIFEITVYPNPTRGMVNIDFNNLPYTDIELLVTDIRGSQVLRKTYKYDDRIQFDLSEKVSGTYLIQLRLNKKRIIRKIILDKK